MKNITPKEIAKKACVMVQLPGSKTSVSQAVEAVMRSNKCYRDMWTNNEFEAIVDKTHRLIRITC